MINRRSFIKHSIAASSALALPQLLRGLPVNVQGAKPNKLVVIQLAGGNDGLNTIVPYKNDIYYKERPNLSIPSSAVIPLSADLGMHPSLGNTAKLFKNGEMSIFNQVGYPDQNRSHFRATDIWLTGSASDKYYTKGWLGKYVDGAFDYPHAAISIDNELSLGLKGEKSLGMAFKNPYELKRMGDSEFFQELSRVKGTKKSTLGQIYNTFNHTQESTDYLFNKFKTVKTKQEYPKHQFSQALKTIGALINSGSNTTVYHAALTGFDTHSNQLSRHQKLMSVLDTGLAPFVKDLKDGDNWNNTLVLVFSEFGRRIGENGSKGTDHGMASNVWLLGGKLNKPGFRNELDLTHAHENDLLHKMDYREIYASILKNWLKSDEKVLVGRHKTFKI